MIFNQLEKFLFTLSLRYPKVFQYIIKPQLYRRYCDPEIVHEKLLEMLNQKRVIRTLEKTKDLFEVPEKLKVEVKGKRIDPFGTAAGMDKNGDALVPFSYVFGFQEPGTVVVNEREGNKKPRIAVIEKERDVYNAQGFPSKGLNYFLEKIKVYRETGIQKPVYVNICGLPLEEEKAIEIAMKEMEILLTTLEPYADGFVWNLSSPNTAALKLLRTQQVFNETAKLMRKYAPEKLLLVKIGPYEDSEKSEIIRLIYAFLEGGGDGVVAVNTKMFPREEIPVRNWGYSSGGRSGNFLQSYRMRAIRDIRKEFREAVIVATGGIFNGREAYETFKAGANLIEGYTPYIFYGLGLFPQIVKGVFRNLKEDGYQTLEELENS